MGLEAYFGGAPNPLSSLVWCWALICLLSWGDRAAAGAGTYTSSSSSLLRQWGPHPSAVILWGARGLPVQLEASVGGCELEPEPPPGLGVPPNRGVAGGGCSRRNWCLAPAGSCLLLCPKAPPSSG